MSKITGWVKCPICEGRGLIDVLVFMDGGKVYNAGKIDKIRAYKIKLGREAYSLEYCPTCKDSKFKGCLPIDE